MTVATLNSIAERVEFAIAHHPHLTRNHLHFNTNDGRVTLRGRVTSYFEKQMAQEALRNIEGVREIENRLTVEWV